jgi:hypothetical protein
MSPPFAKVGGGVTIDKCINRKGFTVGIIIISIPMAKDWKMKAFPSFEISTRVVLTENFSV